MMKLVAAIFFVFVAFLLIQPAVAGKAFVKKMTTCERTCGMTKKCDKDKSSSKSDGDTCNPFMPCSTGNFFLLNKAIIIAPQLIPRAERKKPVNVKLVSDYLSECWHPPELFFI